jgi:hypothetical protein
MKSVNLVQVAMDVLLCRCWPPLAKSFAATILLQRVSTTAANMSGEVFSQLRDQVVRCLLLEGQPPCAVEDLSRLLAMVAAHMVEWQTPLASLGEYPVSAPLT